MARIAMIGLLLLTGCGGNLLVYDVDGNAVKGVPVRMAEVYVKQGTHTKLAAGGACDRVGFIDVLQLPTGAQYYITTDARPLMKTGFHLKFNDVGAVTEINLDTEPAAADTLKAIGDLYKTLFGAAAPVAGAAAAFEKQGEGKLPACDAGDQNITFVKFDDYMKEHSKKK